MLTLLAAGAALAVAMLALRFTSKPAAPRHRASPAPLAEQKTISAGDGEFRSAGGKRERAAAFGRR
jgi:hypothetical protein